MPNAATLDYDVRNRVYCSPRTEGEGCARAAVALLRSILCNRKRAMGDVTPASTSRTPIPLHRASETEGAQFRRPRLLNSPSRRLVTTGCRADRQRSRKCMCLLDKILSLRNWFLPLDSIALAES